MPSSDYLIEETPQGPTLVIVGDWSAEARQQLSLSGVDGLELNYARGFRERSLDFIRELPIRRLWITARTHDALDPIYDLAPHLTELHLIVGSRAKLDLGRLPRLTSLGAEWPVVQASIGYALGLSDLYIGSYDGVDFESLHNLHSLTHLMMKDRPRLESLAGLAAFPQLTHLTVAGAPRLTDFSALLTETGGISLVQLSLQACSKLSHLDELSQLFQLEELNIASCGDIASLRPLVGLRNLRTLLMYESTRILDGDLSPLLELPHLKVLAAQSRRAYRPTVADIEAQLSVRREPPV